MLSPHVDGCSLTALPKGDPEGKAVKEDLPSGLNVEGYICLATLAGLRDGQGTNRHELVDGC